MMEHFVYIYRYRCIDRKRDRETKRKKETETERGNSIINPQVPIIELPYYQLMPSYI